MINEEKSYSILHRIQRLLRGEVYCSGDGALSGEDEAVGIGGGTARHIGAERSSASPHGVQIGAALQ